MASLKRNLKNVVRNYSAAQVKVREATSNDPWGPTSTLMAEISDMTHNTQAFTEIMAMLWKRLADKSKQWRHVYKGLVLMEYLVKTGSEKVAKQCRESFLVLRALGEFQCMDDGRDEGQKVRDKAKQLVALLDDPERLGSERTSSIQAKARLHGGPVARQPQRQREPEQPSQLQQQQQQQQQQKPPVAEDVELELALEMSRVEHEEAELKRRQEEARLKNALEASRMEEETLAPLRMPPPLASSAMAPTGEADRLRSSSASASDQQQQASNAQTNYLDLIDISMSAAPANAPNPWYSPATTVTSGFGGNSAEIPPDSAAEAVPAPPDLPSSSNFDDFFTNGSDNNGFLTAFSGQQSALQIGITSSNPFDSGGDFLPAACIDSHVTQPQPQPQPLPPLFPPASSSDPWGAHTFSPFSAATASSSSTPAAAFSDAFLPDSQAPQPPQPPQSPLFQQSTAAFTTGLNPFL